MKGGERMDSFESLLERDKSAVESFVKFRLSARHDAEDVLQEVYLTAYRNFSRLKNPAAFKPWLISIARNKCNDYFRGKAARLEIPVDSLSEKALRAGRQGPAVVSAVKETLSLLGDRDKQILYLYFWKEMPQAEIASRLHIPVGTVKSRLHAAKRHFKDQYPRSADAGKGEISMKKLPALMPEYRITESGGQPFSVKWEELMGWFLVPRLGEKISWGMYDMPSRKCSYRYDMKVTGKAKVHGIEGVELTARETPCEDPGNGTDRVFAAQLTDTHCRYLASLSQDGDTREYLTFLDGDAFLDNWGFGEDNCGNETNLAPKGDIRRRGSQITHENKPFLLDIVGRYTVEIAGKKYDTVCVMDIGTYNAGVVSEQYLDKKGRTVLWRRFNRDDWAFDQYHKTWSEQLPANEKLTVNGAVYVHWYDCITDYIL